eukprot:gene7704-11833_t
MGRRPTGVVRIDLKARTSMNADVRAMVEIVAAGTSMAAVNPLSASSVGILGTLFELVNCPPGKDEREASKTENPLQWHLEASNFPSSSGAVFGNLLITFGIVVFHFMIAGGIRQYRIKYADKWSWKEAFAVARFPSFSFVPVVLFYEGITEGAYVMLLYGKPWEKPVGGLIIIGFSFGILIAIFMLTSEARFHCELFPVERPYRVLNFLWGDQVWDSLRDRTFFRRWALVFKDMTFARRRFMMVDITLLHGLAATHSYRARGKQDCMIQIAVINSILVVYFGVVMFLRPFLANFDNFCTLMSALLQSLATSLVFVAVAKNDHYGDEISVSGVLLIISSAFVSAMAAVDLLTFVYERMTKTVDTAALELAMHMRKLHEDDNVEDERDTDFAQHQSFGDFSLNHRELIDWRSVPVVPTHVAQGRARALSASLNQFSPKSSTGDEPHRRVSNLGSRANSGKVKVRGNWAGVRKACHLEGTMHKVPKGRKNADGAGTRPPSQHLPPSYWAYAGVPGANAPGGGVSLSQHPQHQPLNQGSGQALPPYNVQAPPSQFFPPTGAHSVAYNKSSSNLVRQHQHKPVYNQNKGAAHHSSVASTQYAPHQRGNTAPLQSATMTRPPQVPSEGRTSQHHQEQLDTAGLRFTRKGLSSCSQKIKTYNAKATPHMQCLFDAFIASSARFDSHHIAMLLQVMCGKAQIELAPVPVEPPSHLVQMQQADLVVLVKKSQRDALWNASWKNYCASFTLSRRRDPAVHSAAFLRAAIAFCMKEADQQKASLRPGLNLLAEAAADSNYPGLALLQQLQTTAEMTAFLPANQAGALQKAETDSIDDDNRSL